MAEVKLFRSWSSPFALRVVWALNLKGIEYDTVFEDLTNKSPSLLEYNPIYKKVPVLLHRGKPIVESLVILEYIDETWEETPLLPDDPLERAAARFWAKFNDDQLLQSIWKVFITQGKEREEALVPATENLKLVEQQLKGKKYFGGERIGYLDIAFGWMAVLVSALEEVGEMNKLVEEEKFPSLSAWIDNFLDEPLIKEFLPPRDKLLVKFQAMREPYLAAAVKEN